MTPETMQMIVLAFGHIPAQAVHAAAALGVVDHLADGPRTTEELARATGADPPSLGRLLAALASIGVLAAEADGRWSSTAIGATLRSGIPGSLRDVVRMAGDVITVRPLAELAWCVRTGKPGFDRAFGAPYFEHLRAHPDAAAVFNDGMAGFSAIENAPIAAAYDFPPAARVVDVGGGQGGFLIEVLRAHPTVRAVLCDLPEVVRDTRRLADAGVTSRVEIVAADFFQNVPPDGDVYVLKRVLHDWDDETCIRLLRTVRATMPAAARLLVIDAVLAEGPDPGRLSDLLMMVISQGRERTERDFRSLFDKAGFQLTRVVPTPTPLALVEGRPRG
jgi:hypothetical protein